VVRFLRNVFMLSLVLCPALFSQTALPSGLTSGPPKTVLIAPFENVSKAPGIEWIGESFPDVIGQRIAGDSLQLMSRTDRLHAFDRAGLPSGLHPARATLFRVAEQLDVDYVVLGSYDFDGHTFTATCQWLDVKRAHLSKKMIESGPLLNLIDIQTALAWDVLRLNDPAFPTSRDAFVAASLPIRLDSLENYTRGVVANSAADKIKYFREALHINPFYSEALMALGQAYFETKQYELAAAALAKVPPAHPSGGQAQFLLGLCAFYLGQFEKAESTFAGLAARVPLPEVYNNLGVAQARRGKHSAVDALQKAADIDPGDSDYSFNLAVALYRKGDAAASTRALREFLAANPGDAEAKGLLESLIAQSDPKFAANAPPAKVPLERIKRTYNEESFRQIAAQIQAANEQRMARSDPHTHARFHVNRGHDLLVQGFAGEAVKDLREAVALDPSNAEAHAGLASALEATSETPAARAEAEAALHLQPSAEAWLVLARLDLRDNKVQEADGNIARALQLDPANASALNLQRTLAAKLAEKAQPLLKP
jgi:tetratricopeptide (TPR) repeat protein